MEKKEDSKQGIEKISISYSYLTPEGEIVDVEKEVHCIKDLPCALENGSTEKII